MPEYRLVQHRGRYSLAYNDARGRVRIALGTDERGLAEARARDIWHARTRPKSERLDDLWPVYLADRKGTVARVDALESLWRALQPQFGYKHGRAITKADCEAYAATRRKDGKRPSTIRTELEILRACLRFHFGKDAPRVWVPPASPPRDRWLTRDDVRKLLAAAEAPHIALFITLAVTTGARMAAILDLTWDRVNFAAGHIDFRAAGREQTNKRRVSVPMNASARAALEAAKEGALTDHVIEYGGSPVASVKKAVAATARRAGVPCSPHVFRHTAGVWMAQADVPMQKIAQYLGHSSTRVTEAVYARYSPSFMRDAGAALEL